MIRATYGVTAITSVSVGQDQRLQVVPRPGPGRDG